MQVTIVIRQLWGAQGEGNKRSWGIIPLFGSAPCKKVVRSGQFRVITQISIHLESDLFLHQLFTWTLIHRFLQRRGCPSVCTGEPPLHSLLWDSCGWSCRWRSPREWLSHSLARCDHRCPGEGDRCLPGCLGEGVKHHWDLFLCLEWECHLLDPNHPVEGSPLGQLATSAPCSLAGDQAHEWEWLWEHLLLSKVGQARPGPLCRPALAMCQASSRYNSTMHSSCHWQESTLGTSTYSPGKPVWWLSILFQWHTLIRSWRRGTLGPSLQPFPMDWLGSAFGRAFHGPSLSWQLHYGAGNTARRGTILGIWQYSSMGAVFLIHWDRADPEHPISHPLWTVSPLGEFLYLLP